MPKAIFEIKRYPIRKNDPLQGWDSADELLLHHAASLQLDAKKVLIINDHFGALSCGLKQYNITSYTDSFVSSKGIIQNSDNQLRPVHQLSQLTGIYDYVFIQIPKNMSYFEDILCRLSHHLNPQSKIVCGAMVKHLAPTSFDLLQKYIGVTSTSLAQKKARLIFATFEKTPVTSPYPLEVRLDSFKKSFINHSNLFSRDKLDIGSRFFLEHLPKGDYKKILDLGCANGVIGIQAKLMNPNATILFSDESSMAIESARTNYNNHFEDEAHFYWTNCFEDYQDEDLDLVLCNPPFHQQNTIGDFIALQMFNDSYKALKRGGCLRVIGNSHLAYQVKIKAIFGNSKIIATNNKFMICEAYK